MAAAAQIQEWCIELLEHDAPEVALGSEAVLVRYLDALAHRASVVSGTTREWTRALLSTGVLPHVQGQPGERSATLIGPRRDVATLLCRFVFECDSNDLPSPLLNGPIAAILSSLVDSQGRPVGRTELPLFIVRRSAHDRPTLSAHWLSIDPAVDAGSSPGRPANDPVLTLQVHDEFGRASLGPLDDGQRQEVDDTIDRFRSIGPSPVHYLKVRLP